ncbi:DUF6492 family protein [Sphaerothrix gracilis]|uniref:DUF6492 family protein n=1 Tax=Sphaerothrix gracilis TaxID=3151835 RepID=UPI0031FBCDF9
MSQDVFDFVIPLYRVRWNTRAVLEGITSHYEPRQIHIITPATEARSLREQVTGWQVSPICVHEEEFFFQKNCELTKDEICAELDLGKSLYTPGWFYQQLLKLGASEGIDDLSEWYVVWDSDLLPVKTWPLIRQEKAAIQRTFALLQHKQWGNPQIVSTWDKWIRSVLGVEPLTDHEGTFVPHHMWFKQSHLNSFKQQLKQYFQSDDHWLLLMMRSANELGTFSEYWAYVSWVAATAPADLVFHPYEHYGVTTERFFDDGTGLFSATLKQQLQALPEVSDRFTPSYVELANFIQAQYGSEALPSSLSFESSPRHLKKDEQNMHIEELRSRWNPRVAASQAS